MVLLSGRLRGLAGGAGGLYEAALYLEDYLSFVEVSRRLDDAAPDAPAPAGTDAIVAQGVSFTYPSREEPSLEDASIVVRRGEVVALVGENGSGKTTFAKLLAGLYRAQGGTITLDGVDIATCDPAAVRERVAVIFQDFMRYELSAYDNVAMGDHTRFEDREAVEQAARAAGIHDVIAGMPHGYDTLLGAEYVGGTDLSGGQWQRVALARAFFRRAPIVILDEPTAALDPRAEARLYESMRELFAGRGVLLISHRFASVRTADRIYVLEGGRVIEEGTHDALIAAGGHYSELFRMQAARYVD
jgi:ATP-binding cassette subfamily B protein